MFSRFLYFPWRRSFSPFPFFFKKYFAINGILILLNLQLQVQIDTILCINSIPSNTSDFVKCPKYCKHVLFAPRSRRETGNEIFPIIHCLRISEVVEQSEFRSISKKYRIITTKCCYGHTNLDGGGISWNAKT